MDLFSTLKSGFKGLGGQKSITDIIKPGFEGLFRGDRLEKAVDTTKKAVESWYWSLDEAIVGGTFMMADALQPKTKEDQEQYRYEYYRDTYGQEAADRYKGSGYSQLGVFSVPEEKDDTETVKRLKSSINKLGFGEMAETFRREQLPQYLKQKQRDIVEGIFDEDPKISPWEALFIAESGGLSMASAVGITYLTRSTSAAAAFLSWQESMPTYLSAKEAGYSAKRALEVAGQEMMGTFALEKVGIDFLFSKVGGGRFAHAILSTLFETGQEETQTIFQNLNAKYSYDKSREIFNGWFETIIGVAPASFVFGLIVPGGGSINNNTQRLIQEISREANVDTQTAERFVKRGKDLVLKSKEEALKNIDVKAPKYKISDEAKILPKELGQKELTPRQEQVSAETTAILDDMVHKRIPQQEGIDRIVELKKEFFGKPKHKIARDVKFDLPVDKVNQELARFFGKDEIDFVIKDRITTEEGVPAFGKYYESMIEVVRKKGKVSSKTLYHEAFHAYVDMFVSEETLSEVMKRSGYNEEQLADAFADYIAERRTFTGLVKGFFNSIRNKISSWIGKENQVLTLFSEIAEGKRTFTIEQLVEKKKGWTPGLREKFDRALVEKDSSAVEKLLPQIPEEYKARFSKEINELAKPKYKEGEIEKEAQRELIKRDWAKEISKDRIDDLLLGKEKVKTPAEKQEWLDSIGKKYYKKIFSDDSSLSGIDEVADSMAMTTEELKAEIERRVYLKEEEALKPKEKISDDVLAEIAEIKKTKELRDLSKEMKDKVRVVFRPSKKKSSRSFALLGNKDTSIPLFSEVFENWAKDGVETIIEPYGGAFTLGTHSLQDAVNLGLQDFHSNIFDQEKYIIMHHIQKSGVLDAEQAVDKAVARLNNKIKELAQKDKVVATPINEFLKKNPTEFIGSNEWKNFVKDLQIGKDVTVYEDVYEKFTKVFQGAIDALYVEKVTDLDSAVMKALLEKIGVQATKSQRFIAKQVGFRAFEDQIYGNYGMVKGFRDADNSFRLAEIKGTEVHLHNMDGAEFVKKFQDMDPDKTGYYLDPPYFKSAQVYKEKALGVELDKFALPSTYFESHQSVFDAQKKGARLALTNDVLEDYFDMALENIKGAGILAYREGLTPTSLIVDSKTSEDVNDFFTRMEEIRREYKGKREMINSLLEKGELTRTALQEIKKEVGLEDSISMATERQLDAITEKVKERISFKEERGFNIQEKGREVEVSDLEYRVVSEKPPIKRLQLWLENFKRNPLKSLDRTLGVISTRLKGIDPSLKRAIRRLESGILTNTKNDFDAVTPWIKQAKKMSDSDYRMYDFALKNGDVTKISELNNQYGMTDSYNSLREALDNLYKREIEVGFDVSYKKNYMPRMIRNADAFIEYFSNQEKWSIMETAIRRKEMAVGRVLDNWEKAHLVNMMIRGYSGGTITLSETGSMKHRQIDKVTPGINDLYHDSISSLVRYITTVNEEIEARRFFGKDIEVKGSVENLENLNESIGAYTTKLVQDGTISINQEFELRQILQARFNPKGTHGLIGVFKNIGYMTILGSPYNAVTQLGDMAFAQYQSGFLKGSLEGVKSVVGKSKVTKEDIGINRIAYELSTEGLSAKATNLVLKGIGLEYVDKIGKNALINGVISKYQKDSQNPTTKFLQELDEIFGDEIKGSTAEDVLLDLQNGDITENVKFLALNKLLDMQPLTLSEVPENYLRGGNSRVFYMLKTWTLKKFDVYRSEIVMKLRTDPVQAIVNFIRLTAFLMLMDAGADEIKDWMLGRKKSLSDKVVDQILKLAGFSRYVLYTTERQGIGKAVIEQIVPPTRLIDNVSKDLINLFKDFDESADVNELRSVQDIPGVGKLYYWWFGRGAEYRKRDTSSEGGGFFKGSKVGVPEIKVPKIKVPKIKMPKIKI